MARYLATVEYQDSKYWISFPGINNAGSHAKRPEDIVRHARAFLKDWTQYGSHPPASLDDAITDPTTPFEGTKLVIFEWEPPRSTGHRIAGYENDELVIKIRVPVDKIDTALALAKAPETDSTTLRSSYPLTREDAHEISGVAVPPGFTYFRGGGSLSDRLALANAIEEAGSHAARAGAEERCSVKPRPGTARQITAVLA